MQLTAMIVNLIYSIIGGVLTLLCTSATNGLTNSPNLIPPMSSLRTTKQSGWL